MKVALVLLVAVLPFACVLPEDDTGPDTCNREGYIHLVGRNIAAVSLPASPDIRAFGEIDAITQDYVETRVNIVYDEGGTILRIYCG